jgi:hypothetical protein
MQRCAGHFIDLTNARVDRAMHVFRAAPARILRKRTGRNLVRHHIQRPPQRLRRLRPNDAPAFQRIHVRLRRQHVKRRQHQIILKR